MIVKYILAYAILQGLAYTIDERQKLGVLGLIAPAVKTQEQQLEQCKANLSRIKEPLDKYVYLSHLQVSNSYFSFKAECIFHIELARSQNQRQIQILRPQKPNNRYA